MLSPSILALSYPYHSTNASHSFTRVAITDDILIIDSVVKQQT